MTWTVLRCRGIGERVDETQMLANVTRKLDPRRFVIKDVPWESNYSPTPNPLGSSFDKSLHDGRALLLKMIRDDPNPVVLLGYSGGAALAGSVAAEIANGDFPMLDIRGVGLISDPLRERTRGSAYGWGIAGQRRIPPANWPVWYCADPADVITCCPPDSPLRTISDQSAAFSLVDPAAWSWDLVQRLRQQRWQATIKDWRNVPAVWKAYSDAIDGAQGYLFRGAHTFAYTSHRVPGTNSTYCDWLADRINSIKE